MARLAGWGKVRGEPRYISPSGENVSRRKYLNTIAETYGWESYSQYQRAPKKPFYRQYLEEAKDVDEDARKIESDFSKAWAAVENSDKAAGGKFRSSEFWPDVLEAAGVTEAEDLDFWKRSQELRRQREASTRRRSYRTRRRR